MKKIQMRPKLIAFGALILGFIMLSWGNVGHERINKAAVMALPKQLQIFFTITLILLHKKHRFQISVNML